MSGSARVTSLDALRDFKEALVEFGADAREALCAAELEIRRTYDWIEERQKHWKRQVREREEEVVRAKNELIQRKIWSEGGRGPGYTEQEVAYRKAVARLREAEDKVETCRRWARQLPQAVTEYEGPARQLAGMLEADLKQSVALLDQKLAALEAYVSLAPAAGRAAAPPEPKDQPAS